MSTATLAPPRPGPVLHPVPSTPAAGADLPADRVEELGRRLDALRDAVVADLGADDAAYIRSVIKAQRALEVAGRALLMAGVLPPAWLAGTAALSLSKVLENMELGHNIMHGQWDWMRDPRIHSSTWDWDNASPAEAWKHSHNYLHHTFTNVVGKDRDVGYGVLRMSEEQAWRPRHLLNPAVNVLLSLTFQWGVALHDVEFDRLRTGEQSRAEAWRVLKGVGRKVRRQVLKDYVAFPLLAGPFFAPGAAGQPHRQPGAQRLVARGHLLRPLPGRRRAVRGAPARGGDPRQWYVRQMMGASNLDGGPLFHLLTGNLSFQIEHHCFPDVPSNRLAELARRCARSARSTASTTPAARCQAVPPGPADDQPAGPALSQPGQERRRLGPAAQPVDVEVRRGRRPLIEVRPSRAVLRPRPPGRVVPAEPAPQGLPVAPEHPLAPQVRPAERRSARRKVTLRGRSSQSRVSARAHITSRTASSPYGSSTQPGCDVIASTRSTRSGAVLQPGPKASASTSANGSPSRRRRRGRTSSCRHR